MSDYTFPTMHKQDEPFGDRIITVFYIDRQQAAVYHYKDAPRRHLWMFDAHTNRPLCKSPSRAAFVGDAFTVLFSRFEKQNESLGEAR